MHEIDYFKNNETLVSFKDLNSDIDISNSKWDKLFNFILMESPVVYFKGARINFRDEKFYNCIKFTSELNLVEDSNHFNILYKVKSSSIELNRSLVSRIWNYYEYPAFVFLPNTSNEETLINLADAHSYLYEYYKLLDDFYIMYRSFEQNVLWIERSVNMPAISITLYK